MNNSGDLNHAHEDSISLLRDMEVDRISALPDEILCHILSFLIPIYSVRTTVLSKRWNKLWTRCNTNLDFDIEDWEFSSSSDQSNYHILVKFVDQVLALRDSSLDITRFRVAWEDCKDFSFIYRWIQVAVNANVVELDVSSYGYCFDLPPCVFTCKSLVSLKVKSDHLTYSPVLRTGCCFPNLKFLHYISGHDSNLASEAHIFRSFPVLQELTIEAVHHEKRVLNFDISAPELRTLTTIIMKKMNKRGLRYEVDYRIEPCKFFIDAPKLENLYVKGEVMSKYTCNNTSSLVQARVQIRERNEASADLVAELFDRISSVRCMTISALDFEPGPCLPQAFSKLIKVEMVFHELSCWKWLDEVLNISPYLETLVLDFTEIGGDSLQPPQFVPTYWKWLDEVFNIRPHLESVVIDFAKIGHCFQPPEFVPTCLSSQLKTVFIKGFKGTTTEIDIAKYLLSYGEVLHEVIVSSPSYFCIDHAEEKILSVEKGSKTCQVAFVEEVDSELSF